MSGLVAAGRTHTGLVRPHNEDSFVCAPEMGLLAVIDGMGGEAAGEVAAAITREHLLSVPDVPEALASANAAILARSQENTEEVGMGCVATAAQLMGGTLTLAHVGDTRAYLLSAAGLEQLTRDHTVVAEVRERHGMTEEQARALPGQHRITRDIGGHHRDGLDWIDTGAVSLQPDDLLLLCSDGLHDLVRDGEISRILGAARSSKTAPGDVVDELIALALSRGGHDNITVVLARFQEQAHPQMAAHEPSRTAAPPSRLARRLVVIMLAAFLAMVAFFVGRASVTPPPPPLVVSQAPPTMPLQWHITAGKTVVMSGVHFSAPDATIEVVLDAGATLLIEDSTLILERLVVRGPGDATVRVSRSVLDLREGAPEVSGPSLTMESL